MSTQPARINTSEAVVAVTVVMCIFSLLVFLAVIVGVVLVVIGVVFSIDRTLAHKERLEIMRNDI